MFPHSSARNMADLSAFGGSRHRGPEGGYHPTGVVRSYGKVLAAPVGAKRRSRYRGPVGMKYRTGVKSLTSI